MLTGRHADAFCDFLFLAVFTNPLVTPSVKTGPSSTQRKHADAYGVPVCLYYGLVLDKNTAQSRDSVCKSQRW